MKYSSENRERDAKNRGSINLPDEGHSVERLVCRSGGIGAERVKMGSIQPFTTAMEEERIGTMNERFVLVLMDGSTH